MAKKKRAVKAVKKAAKKKATKSKSKKNALKTKSAKSKSPVKKKSGKKRSGGTSLMARIAEERKRIEKSERKTASSGRKLFEEATKHLFNQFPELKKFSWTQYTPYWNDGDECLFGCNIDYAIVNEDEDSEELWNLERLHELLSGDVEKKRAEINKQIAAGGENWEIERLRSELEDIDKDPAEIEKKYVMKKAISDLLGGIDENAYQSMFGEGLVTVTRDGVEVSDYDHE